MPDTDQMNTVWYWKIAIKNLIIKVYYIIAEAFSVCKNDKL